MIEHKMRELKKELIFTEKKLETAKFMNKSVAESVQREIDKILDKNIALTRDLKKAKAEVAFWKLSSDAEIAATKKKEEEEKGKRMVDKYKRMGPKPQKPQKPADPNPSTKPTGGARTRRRSRKSKGTRRR